VPHARMLLTCQQRILRSAVKAGFLARVEGVEGGSASNDA